MLRSMTERRRPSPTSVGRADALRLLETDGCAVCRAHDEAEETWLRWFGIEHHGDAGTLELLRSSLGFCPAHTRRLIALGEPAVLRQPWEFVLRAAVGRTERLKPGSSRPPGPIRTPSTERAGIPSSPRRPNRSTYHPPNGSPWTWRPARVPAAGRPDERRTPT